MKVAAVVEREGDRFIARCVEMDRSAEGATAEEAVQNLKRNLEEYFGRARAVAPPEDKPQIPVEIEIVGS